MSTRHNPHEIVGLGVRILEARLKRRLTLKEVGDRLSISHTQISRIERGQFIHASKNVQKICTFLKVPIKLKRQTSINLETRLARLACESHHWHKVMAALADAIEGSNARKAHKGQ